MSSQRSPEIGHNFERIQSPARRVSAKKRRAVLDSLVLDDDPHTSPITTLPPLTEIDSSPVTTVIEAEAASPVCPPPIISAKNGNRPTDSQPNADAKSDLSPCPYPTDEPEKNNQKQTNIDLTDFHVAVTRQLGSEFADQLLISAYNPLVIFGDVVFDPNHATLVFTSPHPTPNAARVLNTPISDIFPFFSSQIHDSEAQAIELCDNQDIEPTDDLETNPPADSSLRYRLPPLPTSYDWRTKEPPESKLDGFDDPVTPSIVTDYYENGCQIIRSGSGMDMDPQPYDLPEAYLDAILAQAQARQVQETLPRITYQPTPVTLEPDSLLLPDLKYTETLGEYLTRIVSTVMSIPHQDWTPIIISQDLIVVCDTPDQKSQHYLILTQKPNQDWKYLRCSRQQLVAEINYYLQVDPPETKSKPANIDPFDDSDTFYDELERLVYDHQPDDEDLALYQSIQSAHFDSPYYQNPIYPQDYHVNRRRRHDSHELYTQAEELSARFKNAVATLHPKPPKPPKDRGRRKSYWQKRVFKKMTLGPRESSESLREQSI